MRLFELFHIFSHLRTKEKILFSLCSFGATLVFSLSMSLLPSIIGEFFMALIVLKFFADIAIHGFVDMEQTIFSDDE